MPKPPYPISGDPIPADWGEQVIDYVAEAMRFVRNPASGSFQVNGTSLSGPQLVELTQLPANDPTVFLADVMIVFRCATTGGQGQCARLFDYNPTAPPDTDERHRQYWSGVGGRGGGSGSVLLRVGGVNNRQIWYRADTCDSNNGQFWLLVNGWWISERSASSVAKKRGTPNA